MRQTHTRRSRFEFQRENVTLVFAQQTAAIEQIGADARIVFDFEGRRLKAMDFGDDVSFLNSSRKKRREEKCRANEKFTIRILEKFTSLFSEMSCELSSMNVKSDR